MDTLTARRCAATLAILMAANAACAADPPVETVRVRAVAHFGLDRATLAARDRDRILAEVGKMKDVTWQTVTATGYTDSTGPKTHNQRLATRRAGAVKSYLVGKGLEASMIKTAAKATASPVADNRTETGRAKNRRAEIVFEGIRAAAR